MFRNTYITTVFIGFLFISLGTSYGQETIKKAIDKYNDHSIPYITVGALKESSAVLLDAREKEEFDVSRLPDAFWVGYETFSLTHLENVPLKKDDPIVVYCAIGVRSEDVAKELKAAGYTNVKNLYGGIFQWKNEGYDVVDADGNTTEEVHAFSKQWGKLLTKAKKIYKLP